MLVHLNKADDLNRMWGFKWDRFWGFSIHTTDYINHSTVPLHSKAMAFINHHCPTIAVTDVYMLTIPSFFNRRFNPVSFIYYLDSSHTICAIVAEVHNTFSEKHMYLLSDPVIKNNDIHFATEKVFHVSPFFERNGYYRFIFSKNMYTINISIDYYREDTLMFNAKLHTSSHPLHRLSMFQTGGYLAKSAIATFPRILIQAFRLKLKHKLHHYRKPRLNHPLSSPQRPPNFLERYCIKRVLNTLSTITLGEITLHLPDGQVHVFGTGIPYGTLHIHDYRAFLRIAFKGDIGFANAYMYGELTAPDLESLFEILILNESIIKKSSNKNIVYTIIRRFSHYIRRNTIQNSRKNIIDHYDLGNAFFSLFLDTNRVYSSAIFENETQSLADAQQYKMDAILDRCDVQKHHHLLEIGSGWGALAIRAAEKRGCRVTTITISQEQYEFVKKEINKRHLDHMIEVKLMDYRLLNGQFDRIVSVEMLEAVGHDFLPTFFNQCYKLLRPKGKAAYQCIMIPESRYDDYRNSQDFIQKYIFPGGHLPTLSHIQSVIQSAGFRWIRVDTITNHYVRTLQEWANRFIANKDAIHEHGFSETFFNTWVYYFYYCSAGFKRDYIHNHQFVIEK